MSLPKLVTEEDAKKHSRTPAEALLWSLKKWNVAAERLRAGDFVKIEDLGEGPTCACCQHSPTIGGIHWNCALTGPGICTGCQPYWYDWENAFTLEQKLIAATAFRDHIFDVLNEKIVEAGKVGKARLLIQHRREGSAGWTLIGQRYIEANIRQKDIQMISSCPRGDIRVLLQQNPTTIIAIALEDTKQPAKVEKKGDKAGWYRPNDELGAAILRLAFFCNPRLRGHMKIDDSEIFPIEQNFQNFINAVIDEREPSRQ